MRDLFDQIVTEGEPAILRLIDEKRQEGVDLDFKEKTNASTGLPDKTDRRILGTALSALSNSMGGLLIWGVEARKDEDRVDCAIAVKPISQIDRFKTEVVRLVSQAIMPRHEGIVVEFIPASSPPSAGYLLVLVERSERRPHRCEIGEKQYFKRIGDSSMAMEHYDIEDSFKRMAVPTLTVEHSIRDASVGDQGRHRPLTATVVVDVLLVNNSQTTARYPYLGLQETHDVDWALNQQRAGMHPRTVKDITYFEGSVETVIHPDTSIVIAVVRIHVPATPTGHGTAVRISLPAPISVHYHYGCLNSRQRRGELRFTPDDLVNVIPGADLA